eukprot:gene9532-12472_t
MEESITNPRRGGTEGQEGLKRKEQRQHHPKEWSPMPSSPKQARVFTPAWPSVIMLILILASSSSWGVYGQGKIPEDLTCKASGMCSLGVSKFWKGDITTGQGLRNALEAVSFKKEIIVSCIANHFYIELMLHLYQDLLDLGMNHFMMLTTEETVCGHIWDRMAYEVALLSQGGTNRVQCDELRQ